MTHLRGEELSKLYPTPKSREALESERQARILARQPKFAPIKISLYSVIMLATSLYSYRFVSIIMHHYLSSTGAVIAGVCFSILIILIGLAALFYMYTCVENLASVVFGSPGRIFALLVGITFICGLALVYLHNSTGDIWPSVPVILLVNFLVTWLTLAYMKRRTIFLP